MSTSDEIFTKKAKERLYDFFRAMYSWEVDFAKIDPLFMDLSEEEKYTQRVLVSEVKKAELDSIFNEFCTNRERKFGRQYAPNYRIPSEFSPDEVELLDVKICNKKKILFTVKTPVAKFEFVVLYKESKWLVDSRKAWLGKWKKYYL